VVENSKDKGDDHLYEKCNRIKRFVENAEMCLLHVGRGDVDGIQENLKQITNQLEQIRKLCDGENERMAKIIKYNVFLETIKILNLVVSFGNRPEGNLNKHKSKLVCLSLYPYFYSHYESTQPTSIHVDIPLHLIAKTIANGFECESMDETFWNVIEQGDYVDQVKDMEKAFQSVTLHIIWKPMVNIVYQRYENESSEYKGIDERWAEENEIEKNDEFSRLLVFGNATEMYTICGGGLEPDYTYYSARGNNIAYVYYTINTI